MNYKAFVFMFYALDAIYDENPNENLGMYLSGLNPFLFNDEGSAVPCEYLDFSKDFTKHFGEAIPKTEEIYDFCKSYLIKNAPKEAVDAFGQIDKANWIMAFEENK